MLYFPPSPINGQEYVGINGATYTWLENRWNSITAIEAGEAKHYVDNGDAFFEFDPLINDELDGGGATG